MSKIALKASIIALIDGITEKGVRGIVFRAVFIILMIGPLFLLICFGYVSTYRHFTDAAYAEKRSIAHLTSMIVNERLDVLSYIGSSLASRPVVINNVKAGNWDDAVKDYSNVFSSFPFIDSVFIIDAHGILKQGISSYQKMGGKYTFDELIGRDYSFRDYYKGVSARWAPYISEVHKRVNAPQQNVVAVAVPIKDLKEDKVLGVLVMQIQLHVFVQWAHDISAGLEGVVYMVDQKGNLVYHPDYDTNKVLINNAGRPLTSNLLKGLSGVGVDYNVVKKRKYLVAYEPVKKYGWGVIVAQPVTAAFINRDKNMIFFLVSYGFILGLALLFSCAIINTLAEGRRIDAALKDSERKYRNLYSSIRDGLVMTDMKGTMIESNQAFLDMVGYSMDELRTMTYPDITPEKWWAAEKDIVEYQVLVRGYSDAYEKEYIKKTGKIFPVSMKIWLIKDVQGNHLGMWGIVRDITESKQAEENIRVLNVQLQKHARDIEAVNNELQAFSYSVSHDLRAPLRAMEGFSKILLEDQADKLDDKGKDYLNRISGAAASMDNLINNLLTLARVARAPCKKEQFDLSALAQEVVNEIIAANPGSRVECRIAPGMRAYGDVPLCKIVLENLLGNAWKFTSKVRQPVVEVGAVEKEQKIVFFVRDNGAGFDMAYANKLFTPFQRLHPAADYPGTGIGLASVLRIISRHGGEIYAEGHVNEGATFYFTL